MDDKTVIIIGEMMSALTTLTGLPMIWKDAGGMAEAALPMEQGQHCHPFCTKVKTVASRLRKCRHNDDVLVAAESGRKKKPFLHRCHAGVSELVVPIFSGGLYIGAFYMGPFRRKKARCGYPECRKEFDAVMWYDPEKTVAAERILQLLEQEVSQRRQTLALRRIAEDAGVGRLSPALEYIDLHYAEPIAAVDVAGKCHLSTSRFIHIFKEQCGVGFSTYLTRRRVEEAKRLLTSTKLKIGEVAFRCGFQGQSYFGMVFRRETGTSPNVYRARCCRIQEP